MKLQISVKPKNPKKINSKLKLLISKLGLKPATAKFLPYTHTSDNYRATYCFNNCEDETQKTDCTVVYGWQIWEDKKNSFLEAEFHSVIRNNKGQLLDISLRQTGDKKILFVPDLTRKSGRKNTDSWTSWTNIKIQNDMLIAEPQEVEVKELDDDYSEITYVET